MGKVTAIKTGLTGFTGFELRGNPVNPVNPVEEKSWPRVKLGDLGTITRGNGIKRSETRERGYPCLRYGEIYTSYDFVLDRPRSFVSKEVFDGSLHIKKNDLVFTLTGETEDEIAKTLAYLGDEEIAAGGDLAVWKDHGCDPKYLAYLMYSPELIRAKSLASNGQIIVHISVKKFQQIEIPLPPLAVQREIVARLEKDLAMVERMAKGFEALKNEADQLFKSTLKETFEEVSRGGTETRRLGDVCEIQRGGSPRPIKNFITDDQNGLNWIKIGDVSPDGKYITKTADKIKQSGLSKTRQVFEGDFLLSNSMSFGRPYILRINGCIHDGWLVLRGFKNTYLEDYFYYLLRSDCVQDQFNKLAHGSTVRNLNTEAVAMVEVCEASFSAQRTVVARLDAAKAKCEAIKSAAQRGAAECARLRKAILKEAFE